MRAIDTADSTDTSAVTVTLNISASPLTVTAATSSLNFIFGDTPATQSFAVSVTTSQLQQWTVTSDAPWLNVPSTASTGSGSFNEIVDTTGLAPGTYTANLQVAKSGSAPNPVALQFTLTVTPASLTVVELSYLFGGADGRASLTVLPVNFSLSTGQASYPYTIALTTDSGGNWLSVDHTTGSVGSSGTSVNLSVNATLLRGGTYTGEFQLTTTVNGTTFTDVRPVTLNIEANRIVVTASGVGFSKIAGNSVLTRTVQVLSTLGRTNTPWSATSDSSWLTVTQSGVTGGNLVLTADATSAPLDTTQFANVTITSSDSTVENQQKIRVGLFVSNTAPVDADFGSLANALATSPVEPIVAIGSNGTSVGLYDVNSGALVRTISNVAATSGALVFSEDGQSLFVYDSTNFRVTQVDAVSGAQIATFDATGVTGTNSGTGALLTMHPSGYPMLITSGGRTYDLGTGALYTNSLFPPSALALTKSYDQSMLATESGANCGISRSALNGGILVMRSGIVVGTAQGSPGEACFSASADRIYTASGYPYDFPATSLSTGQVIQTLPGTNYPNSMQCVWNGLVIGGVDGYYASDDIFVYDGPSGVSLAQLSSNGQPGAYRDLEGRGMAVSADGTRLMSAWGGSQTANHAGGALHLAADAGPVDTDASRPVRSGRLGSVLFLIAFQMGHFHSSQVDLYLHKALLLLRLMTVMRLSSTGCTGGHTRTAVGQRDKLPFYAVCRWCDSAAATGDVAWRAAVVLLSSDREEVTDGCLNESHSLADPPMVLAKQRDHDRGTRPCDDPRPEKWRPKRVLENADLVALGRRGGGN